MVVNTIQVKDANGVIQTVATLPLLGQQTGTNSFPVVLASGTVVPVTENSSIAFFTQTINISASAYTAGNCIGGLITMSGLQTNTTYSIIYLRLQLSSLPSAETTLWGELFNLNPTGSTYTDNTASVLVTADIPKRVGLVSAGEIIPTTGQTTFPLWDFGVAGGQAVNTDGTGNIYFAATIDTGFSAIASGHLYVQAAFRS